VPKIPLEQYGGKFLATAAPLGVLFDQLV